MSSCPECHSTNMYEYQKPVTANGPYGPALIPGIKLGPIKAAEMRVVVCGACGLLRHYATTNVLARIAKSSKWSSTINSSN